MYQNNMQIDCIENEKLWIALFVMLIESEISNGRAKISAIWATRKVNMRGN